MKKRTKKKLIFCDIIKNRKMNELSNRLQKGLLYVDFNANVLDIGSDHGYFPLELEKINPSRSIYACENKKGPFENLKKTIISNNSKVKYLLSDGIDDLPKEVDTLTIFGMGGKTIVEILSNNVNKLSQIDNIIIEPQSEFSLIYEFLNNLNYQMIDGEYIYEKRYYPICKFIKGKEEVDECQREFGKIQLLKKDLLLKEFLHIESDRINNLPKVAKKLNLTYLMHIKEALKYYE